MATTTQQCCPRFDPEPWQNKELTWDDKKFVKDHIVSFLHVPLNFGEVMRRNASRITSAKAMPERKETIWLSDENSPWGADVYISVTKDVPTANMTTLSGTFLTRVFDGPHRRARKWAAEVAQEAEKRGKKVKNTYFFYTTCPKCAKKYGRNYVVVFAEVEPASAAAEAAA